MPDSTPEETQRREQLAAAERMEASLYLARNPDVQEALTSGEAATNGWFTSAWEHYTRYGRTEGRGWTVGQEAYLIAHPEARAAIRAGEVYDATTHARENNRTTHLGMQQHLAMNPDIAERLRTGELTLDQFRRTLPDQTTQRDPRTGRLRAFGLSQDRQFRGIQLSGQGPAREAQHSPLRLVGMVADQGDVVAFGDTNHSSTAIRHFVTGTLADARRRHPERTIRYFMEQPRADQVHIDAYMATGDESHLHQMIPRGTGPATEAEMAQLRRCRELGIRVHCVDIPIPPHAMLALRHPAAFRQEHGQERWQEAVRDFYRSAAERNRAMADAVADAHAQGDLSFVCAGDAHLNNQPHDIALSGNLLDVDEYLSLRGLNTTYVRLREARVAETGNRVLHREETPNSRADLGDTPAFTVVLDPQPEPRGHLRLPDERHPHLSREDRMEWGRAQADAARAIAELELIARRHRESADRRFNNNPFLADGAERLAHDVAAISQFADKRQYNDLVHQSRHLLATSRSEFGALLMLPDKAMPRMQLSLVALTEATERLQCLDYAAQANQRLAAAMQLPPGEQISHQRLFTRVLLSRPRDSNTMLLSEANALVPLYRDAVRMQRQNQEQTEAYRALGQRISAAETTLMTNIKRTLTEQGTPNVTQANSLDIASLVLREVRAQREAAAALLEGREEADIRPQHRAIARAIAGRDEAPDFRPAPPSPPAPPMQPGQTPRMP